MSQLWPAPAWTFHDVPLNVPLFWSKAAATGYPLMHGTHWVTDVDELPAIDGVIFTSTGHRSEVLIEREQWIGMLNLEDGQVQIRIMAASREVLDAALVELVGLFPASEPSEDAVPVSFWTYGLNGPRLVSRKIQVASWEQVAVNYPAPTRGLLEQMMDGRFRPSHGGQLVLWQGEPGTGKTNALRALASGWRAWAEMHYIVDPERLFGDHADYLIDVLLHDHSDLPGVPSGHEARWRVLVLEDTGELLAADAKEKTGQALSRLLNTVDGMIGQGLRILVLVTTNEELKKLHPAVARPGRCAMQITFDEFNAEEACEWAAAHRIDGFEASSTQTLAELYAAAAGYAQRPVERLVGFAR